MLLITKNREGRFVIAGQINLTSHYGLVHRATFEEFGISEFHCLSLSPGLSPGREGRWLVKVAPIQFVLVFFISQHHVVVKVNIGTFNFAKEGSNGNIHLVSYDVVASVVSVVSRLYAVDSDTLENVFQLGSNLFLYFVFHCSNPFLSLNLMSVL